MVDHCFDRLAAALAADPSRRELLRLISGRSLLAVLDRLGSDEAAARNKRHKKKCKGARKKCGKRCIPKANCCKSSNCPQGEVCRNGHCSNCVDPEDCTPPSLCQQAACEDGRCVFDSIPGGGLTLECGVGACRRTVDQCVDGEEQQCVPGQSSVEICNGIDDDCDGTVDNGTDLCPVDAPSTCGTSGVCAEGSCQKYGSQTVCQPGSCVGTTRQPAAKCDGNGDCLAPPTQSCSPFLCHDNGVDCIGSCGGDVNCVPGHFCFQGGCIPLRGNGAGCDFSSQCASNFCDNGTCQPKRANGEQCAFAEQCASTFCVANICCSTPCSGAGKTCLGGDCQE